LQETQPIEVSGEKPANILYVVMAEDSQNQLGVKSRQARTVLNIFGIF